MKKNIAITSICLFLGTLSQIASAEEKKSYVEIGAGSVAYEEAGWRLVPKIVKLTAGTKIVDHLAIEAMGAFGAADSTVEGITLKVDSMLGLYLKPYFNLGDSVELYGKLGYTRLSGTASGIGGSISAHDSGFSYGAGGAFKFDDTYSVFLDYMQYYDKNGVTVRGATGGLRIAF